MFITRLGFLLAASLFLSSFFTPNDGDGLSGRVHHHAGATLHAATASESAGINPNG